MMDVLFTICQFAELYANKRNLTDLDAVSLIGNTVSCQRKLK